MPLSSRPDGGGAAAAEATSSIQARTPQAAQANAGLQSLMLGQDKEARRPREPRRSGWRRIAHPGPEPGVLSSSLSTLRQAGREEEGARLEAPRARRRVPLFLPASSRAVASRGRLRLRGGGGEKTHGEGRFPVSGPSPPRDRVRGSDRPLRPCPGAPPRQGSGPRGDLERACPPAPLALLPVLSAITELVSSPARDHARPDHALPRPSRPRP